MAPDGFIQETFWSNARVCKSYILIKFIALMGFYELQGTGY